MDLKKRTSSSDRVGPGPGLSSLTLRDFWIDLIWAHGAPCGEQGCCRWEPWGGEGECREGGDRWESWRGWSQHQELLHYKIFLDSSAQCFLCTMHGWVGGGGTEALMRSTWRLLLLKRLTSATTSSFKTFWTVVKVQLTSWTAQLTIMITVNELEISIDTFSFLNIWTHQEI